MHKNERNWIVLLIGGPSGTGKSSIAYKLAGYYGVSVLEIDDIIQALEVMTTKETMPALHYWDTGIDWKDVGVSANVDWLTNVSKEIIPALKAIIDNHIEGNVPIIIEGDFLSPSFIASLDTSKVQSIFINEPDQNQIIQNYLNREGGLPQDYRAQISVAYGKYLLEKCKSLDIPSLESRPWDTAIKRAIKILK